MLEDGRPSADYLGLKDAVRNDDAKTVSALLTRRPDLLHSGSPQSWLHQAAEKGHLETVKVLVQHGLDVNALGQISERGALYEALGDVHVDVTRWLLEHGAKQEWIINGKVRAALETAVGDGNLEIIRLLVEHGGNVNHVWDGTSILWRAVWMGYKDVIRYLLDKGAKMPWQLPGGALRDPLRDVVEHVAEHFGKPNEKSLELESPAGLPLYAHSFPPAGKRKCVTLVTSGMSARPLNTPPDEIAYQFAELYMHLPADWPTDLKTLQKKTEAKWPFELLGRLANQPHLEKDWLGGPFAVVANGEPPAPLGKGVTFTAALLSTSDSELERFSRGGRITHLYLVTPIYTEEYGLVRKDGPEALIKLFKKHKISQTYDPKRPNVAKLKK
jgi:hypothetical protein